MIQYINATAPLPGSSIYISYLLDFCNNIPDECAVMKEGFFWLTFVGEVHCGREYGNRIMKLLMALPTYSQETESDELISSHGELEPSCLCRLELQLTGWFHSHLW